MAGHLLIIDKALYGFFLHEKPFNHLLNDVLCSLSFELSRAELSIYICEYLDTTKVIYEYICSYVDDLITVISNPDQFLKDLQSNYVYGFKFKGSEEVKFHLRCGSVCDRTRTLCMKVGRYVDKMYDN